MIRLLAVFLTFALIGAVTCLLVDRADKFSHVMADSPPTMSDIMRGE
jgi:hypothetical protein